MASKLPLREEFESWAPFQVADLLQQFGMHECSAVVEKLGIDGARFLNVTEYELNKFSIMHQPQIQKMVHDIKKNEGGFMSKIKKIKNKAPPSVPQRDYIDDEDDEEQWSDDFESDYENPDEQHSDVEQYVVPGEEDNYEPPPMETEKKKIVPGFAFPKEVYADNRTDRQPPFSKPLPSVPSQPGSKPNLASLQSQPAVRKPHAPPIVQNCSNDEDDYVVPVDDEEEDNNYIEPTEDNLPQLKKIVPTVTRSAKPTPPGPVKSSAALVAASPPVVYEVLEKEEKPSPPLQNRKTKPLPPKPMFGLSLPSLPNQNAVKDCSTTEFPRTVLPLPRNHSQPKLINPEPPQDDEYEICDNDDPTNNGAPELKFPSLTTPAPFPRTGKKVPVPPKQKPNVPPRENIIVSEVKPIAAERRRGSSVGSELPPVPALKPVFQKPDVLPKPPDIVSRNGGTPPRNIPASSTAEQEAGVYSKVWYASSCDRKAAEEALYKSNKDGSFLVRKSSGQDLKQPYTLVVFYNRRVFNIPVRYIESTRQYAMGREKSGEERFDSVADMIQNHQRNPLVLIDNQNNTKDSTKLKYPVRVS
ncbi:B-cell linker protein isoform X2 [Rhinatrema bivittatum]|uniref:B-cell linker protein isoform X2 n=1 Tax=Rhinatrema bivittatum TaxID=194408 RepID=UPI00112B317A|nr:B-cell linker protein isoform X2 [Rhinatrema bivittatum]